MYELKIYTTGNAIIAAVTLTYRDEAKAVAEIIEFVSDYRVYIEEKDT